MNQEEEEIIFDELDEEDEDLSDQQHINNIII